MASLQPQTTTHSGFTRWMNLTHAEIDKIIELVSEGVPPRDATREVGTSITQFTRLMRHRPEIGERFKEAQEEGTETFRASLRAVLAWHAFESKEYKAARDLAIIYLPEWAALKSSRVEIGLTPETLRQQAQEAFADLTTEELEQRIKLLEAGNVVELPQAVGD